MAHTAKFKRGYRKDLPRDFKGREVDIYVDGDDIYFVWKEEKENSFENLIKESYGFLFDNN